ncbi:TetR family transcriptional regulator [Brevibacillus sp. B_LB10_24]|uniref:TetR family transcriptional regulator n=1 Tax=Brevibacillus sp. B_LB10_24 TaxID=3380645 RepID=UPI0038BD74A0
MAPKVSEEYRTQKKLELLRAAKRVFIRKGYTDATMQDIMDEAGVSRGALYSYFENIEHAFIEVLRQEDQKVLHIFEPDDQTSLWRQLADWVRGQQKSIEEIHQSLLHAMAEFFLSAHYLVNKAHFPYIAERYQRVADAIARLIQKGAEQGEFRPRMSPEAIALYFVSFIDGLMLNTFQLGPEKTKVGEQLAVLLVSLEAMLAPATEE